MRYASALKCPPAAAAVATLSLLLAAPVFAECIDVVPSAKVRVRVASCATLAQAAPEIRAAYTRRWQQAGAQSALVSPEKLNFDLLFHGNNGQILHGRVISATDPDGVWKSPDETRDQVFVTTGTLSCAKIRKGDRLELAWAPACCDVSPTQSAECILQAAVLWAPVTDKPGDRPTQGGKVAPAIPPAESSKPPHSVP
jgi:hypothetical protein